MCLEDLIEVSFQGTKDCFLHSAREGAVLTVCVAYL